MNLQQYCGLWDLCQIDTVNEIDLRHIDFFFPQDFELNQRIPCGILFWMESSMYILTYVVYVLLGEISCLEWKNWFQKWHGLLRYGIYLTIRVWSCRSSCPCMGWGDRKNQKAIWKYNLSYYFMNFNLSSRFFELPNGAATCLNFK